MNLIVSADKNWAIGKDGRPLVTIPADQQLFLQETKGKVVVMGRKTLEGLPGGRPLGNRVNVVLSRDPKFKMKGAEVFHSMEEALSFLSGYESEDIFVIGGESIYRQFLPYCDTVHVTRIDYTYDADTYFPEPLTEPNWELSQEGEEQTYFSLCYTFQKYTKKL